MADAAPHPRQVFDLKGHEAAETAFEEARGRGRLHHAWLLTGTEGVGKATFAFRAARRLLGAPHNPAYGVLGASPDHPVSRQTIARSHPDLMVLERVGEDGKPRKVIPVDEARKLTDFFAKSPAAAPHRVAIIDAADDLNVNAANAVLKTLEEPPPRTLLLLLTTQPEQLLPTIQSRVIEVGLMPPAGARLFTEHENKLLIVLGKHAAKGSGTLAGALALKVEFEEILEELHEDLKKRHEEEFERETEHYGKTTDGSWLKQREEQVEAAIEADYIQQRSALMDLLLSWFGDVARQQAGAEHLDLPKHQSMTASLASKWPPDEVTRRVRVLRQLESHLHTNVNESLALEVCFIQAFGG